MDLCQPLVLRGVVYVERLFDWNIRHIVVVHALETFAGHFASDFLPLLASLELVLHVHP